jgi:ribosomal protein S18 acetylase RimI-like enzyme
MRMNLEVVELDNYDLPLLEELIQIQKETFDKLGLNEGTLPMMIKFGRVFLLKRDSEILGSAEFMKDWKDGRRAFMVGFCVKETERRKGLGKFFLSRIISRIEHSVSKIELTVAPANRAALGLYRQVGFEDVAYLKDVYGAGEDRLLLRLNLAE